MKKFEYISEFVIHSMTPEKLDEFGNKGWELCAMFNRADVVEYNFKRQIII